jgi:hypothetical protein
MRNVHRLGFFGLIATSLALSLAFVGCGSSSDGSSDDSAGSDASSQTDTSLADSSSGDTGLGTDTGADSGPIVPCAPGSTYVDVDGGTHPTPPPQSFGAHMTGCPGTVRFDDRATLCGASCAPCSADQWVAMHGTAKPSYNYWTNDNLNYSGEFTPGSECYATLHAVQDGDAGIPYVEACGSEIDLDDGGTEIVTAPMRVCYSNDSDPFGDQLDPLGNECNWTRCALGLGEEIIDAGADADADVDAAPPSFDSMGGCDDNYTAGTLCCCP